MHAASLDKSKRLQRVLKVLREGKALSTRTIIRIAHVCAVNSIISELRDNGIRVTCRRKGPNWYYKLAA